MKPIENIFNFNCMNVNIIEFAMVGIWEINFRYCRKSTEKIEENEKLQQENQQLKLELSGYRQAILEDKEMLGLQQENQHLKDNWNELKKYIDKNKLILNNPNILDFYMKMQELEKGKSE